LDATIPQGFLFSLYRPLAPRDRHGRRLAVAVFAHVLSPSPMDRGEWRIANGTSSPGALSEYPPAPRAAARVRCQRDGPTRWRAVKLHPASQCESDQSAQVRQNSGRYGNSVIARTIALLAIILRHEIFTRCD